MSPLLCFSVVQLLFEPLYYTVSEEQGTLEPTITQVGDSERPITFRAVYNRNTTTATSKLAQRI